MGLTDHPASTGDATTPTTDQTPLSPEPSGANPGAIGNEGDEMDDAAGVGGSGGGPKPFDFVKKNYTKTAYCIGCDCMGVPANGGKVACDDEPDDSPESDDPLSSSSTDHDYYHKLRLSETIETLREYTRNIRSAEEDPLHAKLSTLIRRRRLERVLDRASERAGLTDHNGQARVGTGGATVVTPHRTSPTHDHTDHTPHASLPGDNHQVEGDERVRDVSEEEEHTMKYEMDLFLPTDYYMSEDDVLRMRHERARQDQRPVKFHFDKSATIGDVMRKVLNDKYSKAKAHYRDHDWPYHARAEEEPRGGCFGSRSYMEVDTVFTDQAITNKSSINKQWRIEDMQRDPRWQRRYVEWAIDSGTTHSVAKDEDVMTNVRPTRMTITGVHGKAEELDGKGNMVGTATDINGDEVELKLDKTVLHKRSNMNLVAGSGLLSQGNVLHLEAGNCYMICRGKHETRVKVPIEERGGLFILKLEHLLPPAKIQSAMTQEEYKECVTNGAATNTVEMASLDLWHRRLNHVGKQRVKVVFDRKTFEGLDIRGIGKGCDKDCPCQTCAAARAIKQPVRKQRRFEPTLGGGRPFKSVQTDIKGPLVQSIDGYAYTMPFICEDTRYAITYYLRDKSEAPQALAQYIKDIANLGYAAPMRIRTDGGSELCGSRWKRICKKNGIQHRVTPPHKSTLNGIVERYHRTTFEAANAYLVEAKLNSVLYPYAVKHAEWVYNRLAPSQGLGRLSPYEIVHQRRPRADRVRVFGSSMYALDHADTTKARPGRSRVKTLIYIGVPANSDSGYLGLDPQTRRVVTAYDVTFDETLKNRANNLIDFDGLADSEGKMVAESREFDNQAKKVDSAGRRNLYRHRLQELLRRMEQDEEEAEPVDTPPKSDPNEEGHTKVDKPRDVQRHARSADEEEDDLPRIDDEPELADQDDDVQPPNDKPDAGAEPHDINEQEAPTAEYDDWRATLPRVEMAQDDKYLGSYIQAPFEGGWYFGVVTNKLGRKDKKKRELYSVTFEDDDEMTLNTTLLRRLRAEVDDARKKVLPTPRELKELKKAGMSYSNATQTNVEEPAQEKGATRRLRDPGPLSSVAIDRYLIRRLHEDEDGRIRPLRLEPVGRATTLTAQDKLFIDRAMKENLPIVYLLDNPKRGASQARYTNYSVASTLKESIELSVAHRAKGVSKDAATKKARLDIAWDYRHGYIFFPGNESMLNGHYLNAKELAREYKIACRAESLMNSEDNLIDEVLSSRAEVTLQQMLLDNRREEDALKYMENTTTLNAFMMDQMKKVKLYSPETGEYHVEPTTDREADTGPDRELWRRSKEKELDAMNEFDVFELVTDMPAGAKPISAKFVYKLKTGDDGNITTFKSRLVARGFSSREGIDYESDQVYAPVMNYDSFRSILAIAAMRGLRVEQADISNAYLQGRLLDRDGNQKHLYLIDPLHRKDPDGRPYYLKLSRPIYGLVDSAWHWNQALTEHLLSNGLERAESDPCLFTLNKPRRDIVPDYDGDEVEQLICGIYVDDLTYASSSPEMSKWFNDMLDQRFKIRESDRGELKYMLGTRVRQDLEAGTVTMDQRAMIEKLAERFGQHKSNPNARNVTPMVVEALPKQTETTTSEDFDYKSAVGSLLFISGMTRPDVAYSVGAVARHGIAHGEAHVRAVRRIIQYLYHTRTYGITYHRADQVTEFDPLRRVQDAVMYQAGRPPIMNDQGTERLRADPLRAFCDADFGDHTTMRSTTGIITFLSGGPISWTSKLQKVQALSTTEAEVYAATEAVKDAAHLKLLLHDLGCRDDVPIPIHEDNTACIQMTRQRFKAYSRARHYTQRVSFLQERVADKTIEMVQTPTSEEIADALTKPLPSEHFIRFRDAMVSEVNPLVASE